MCFLIFFYFNLEFAKKELWLTWYPLCRENLLPETMKIIDEYFQIEITIHIVATEIKMWEEKSQANIYQFHDSN